MIMMMSTNLMIMIMMIKIIMMIMILMILMVLLNQTTTRIMTTLLIPIILPIIHVVVSNRTVSIITIIFRISDYKPTY